MSIALKTNNGTQVLTHSPTPAVVISNAFRHDDDLATLKETTVTWSISGVLTPGGGTMDDQITEMLAHYAGAVMTEVTLVDSALGVIAAMPTAGNIKVTSIDFPEGSGPELATKRTYIITLEGKDVPVAIQENGECVYNISYSTAQNGKVTISISGTMTDVFGQDAEAKYAAFKIAQNWDAYAGYNLITDEYTVNHLNTVCTFSILHTEYFIAFGTGITNADVSKEVNTDNQDVERERVSGWFEGSEGACNSAISVVRPSGVCVSERIVRNDHTNRTSFNLEYINTVGNDIIYEQETLSIQESVDDFVHQRVIGGGSPVKHSTSKTPGRATQSGVIKKLEDYPSVPALYWPSADLKSKRVTRISPEYNVSSGYVYGLTYTYEFEFAGTPTF